MRIAVNISADQFHQNDFIDHLEATLAKTGIASARFTCEITESVAMQDTEHAQFIARTIVAMAHELNLRVVAEGVETSEQRDLLVEMGCDELRAIFSVNP